MTKEQILTAIISAIISAFVSSFAKPFTEKIFEVIMPNTKKVISFIKKVFFFILRYGLASFWIIKLLISTTIPFDKFWVLQFCIQFLILGIIVSFDIFLLYFTKHLTITKNQSLVIEDLAKTTESHNKHIQQLAEVTCELSQVIKKHFSITKKILGKPNEEKAR